MRPNSIIIFMVYILTIFTGVNGINTVNGINGMYDRYSIHRHSYIGIPTHGSMHHYRNPFEIIQTPKIELPVRILRDHPFEFRINRCPSSCLFGRDGRFSRQYCATICGFNHNIPY